VISHDRYFLNSISTSFIGLGVPKETGYLFSDFDQWQKKLESTKKIQKQSEVGQPGRKGEKKRSTREIENQIEKTDADIKKVEEELALANPKDLESLCKKHLQLKKELEDLYTRWEDLLKS
jgi:ATPase subunit of ABC transporter with duplicated ATPase domains